MTIDLSAEQRQAVLKGEVVRLSPPAIGQEVVLVRAEVFDEIQEQLKDEEEQGAFRKFARKQAANIAKENPF